MLLTFEVSKPFQGKPWVYTSKIGWRVGWLWFAVGHYRAREDELMPMFETIDNA